MSNTVSTELPPLAACPYPACVSHGFEPGTDHVEPELLEYWENPSFQVVRCQGCGTSGPPMTDGVEAVKAWNGMAGAKSSLPVADRLEFRSSVDWVVLLDKNGDPICQVPDALFRRFVRWFMEERL